MVAPFSLEAATPIISASPLKAKKVYRSPSVYISIAPILTWSRFFVVV